MSRVAAPAKADQNPSVLNAVISTPPWPSAFERRLLMWQCLHPSQ